MGRVGTPASPYSNGRETELKPPTVWVRIPPGAHTAITSPRAGDRNDRTAGDGWSAMSGCRLLSTRTARCPRLTAQVAPRVWAFGRPTTDTFCVTPGASYA